MKKLLIGISSGPALICCFFILNYSSIFAQFPGCPAVDAGSDQTLTCNQPCANLTAVPFPTGATTSYTVGSIPHTPPIAYNEPGGTAVSVNTDDVWSPQINLPFNFCYYGQTYTTCKIGSNGSIKFGTYGPTTQPWSFTASCPSTALTSAGDVFGVYHDIDPSVAGSIKWYLLGAAPCRIFVVSYDDMGHFSCTGLRSTHMMVLYETTNVIDVYVQEKETCSGWNGGRAIIGIQNPAGTAGIAAPNRNSSPTWTVTTPEAWRFTPSGAPIYTVDWLENGSVIGTGTTISVCPTAVTTYTARATYTACDGTIIIETDNVVVSPDPSAPSGSEIANAPSDCIAPNGSFEVQGSGGAGGYTYSIDNGVTTQANGIFTGLAPGTYNVQITDLNGCTGSVSVTIAMASTPIIDAGPDQSVCPGGTVTLSGSGGVSYTWNNGVSDGVSFSPGSTTTYTVTGTDANGCQNTDQVTISLYTLPTVDAGTPQTICPGASVTLNGSGATSYTWDNGVTNGVSFTPGTTTTYTVTGTDGNGCTNTDQVTVTVNALPAVDAGAPQNVCTGGTVTLNGSGATSYTWDNGVTNGVAFTPGSTTTYTVTGTDGAGCQNTDQVTVTVNGLPTVDAGAPQTVCLGASVSLSGSGATSYVWTGSVTNGVPFIPPSTATYTVTGTDANGCQNTDQVTVTVNNLPIVDAGLPQAVCAGTAVTLNGSGASSYTWNNGINNGVSFTPGATTTYTVTGTDANGCQNTDQVTVTVNALPNVNAGVDQSVCIGGSVTVNGSGATSYVWNNGVTNGVSFTPGATTTYTVTGTDGNGCTDTDQMIVTVNPLPTVNAGTDQTICLGSSVTLTGSGASSYSWTNGVTNNVSFNPALGTVTYTVTGTDANGCTDTDQITVTVVPVPVADINSAGPLSGYPGLQVVFTNGSQLATSYDVDFDNGQTATSTNLADTYTGTFNAPGVYTVVLTASNGICTDTDEMDVIVIPYEPLVIHVPNVFTPDGDGVNDEFYIEVENGATIDVIIVNRWENPIMTISDFATHWDGMVNGNEASEGTYFFKYSITGLDGTTQTGQGFVELIRK